MAALKGLPNGVCFDRSFAGGGYAYRKIKKANDKTDYETWIESEITNCLNLFDLGDVRTAELIITTASDASEGGSHSPSPETMTTG